MPVVEAQPVALYDQAKDRRLSQLYAPVYALILQLRAAHDFGDADVLRRRIKDLLDRAEREALRAGLPSEELRSAKFALVAFIDETILSSDWSQKDHWVAKPLQLEFFDRYDAGEGFFDRLEEMLRQPTQQPEVLEVYYLCMTLGFKGRYLLHDQERLRMLIEETYSALSRTPGMVSDVLSPHGKPRGQVATEVQSKVPLWAILLFAAVIGLLVYIGLSLYISSAAAKTAADIEAVPRTEAAR